MLIRLFTSKYASYVGDSTAKVVKFEQITTNIIIPKYHSKLVILPQR